jgi:hypothetical protein
VTPGTNLLKRKEVPMRKALVLTTLTLAALAAARWQARPAISFADAERVRLRAHFDSVERELRGRDVSGLTPAQRAARGRLIEILHGYQVRGVFPWNTEVPDRAVPIFVDRWGTRCAFAYLIEQTGNEDLVVRIARTRNNARAPELKDDPEVGRWLVANGITLAEATRIQPEYCAYSNCPTIPNPVTPTASAGYQVASGVTIAGNVTAFTLNLVHTGLSRQASGLAAIGTGAVGLIVGGPNLGSGGSRGSLGVVNAAVGSASLVLGLVRLTANGEPAAESRLSVGPWLGARGASGVAARVTF